MYQDKTDLQLMIDLTCRVRPADFLNDYPGKTDLEENLASIETRANTRLWFEGRRLIGYAYVDDFKNLTWEADDQFMEWMGPEIIAWGEACIRKVLAKGETSTLDASCRDDYSARLSFLKQHGFCQTDESTVRMARDLAEAIPVPQLPQGFQIRIVKGVREAETIASLHRAAFGTDYMTTAKRLAIMNTSDYDPTLDLVVVAPDGMLAAYCTCSLNPLVRAGSADTVATHPRFRRLGLARALLLTALKLLKERGMKSVSLGTSGENIPLQKAAASIGFHVDHTVVWFEKKVFPEPIHGEVKG